MRSSASREHYISKKRVNGESRSAIPPENRPLAAEGVCLDSLP
jgi:hypothetical protein